MSLENDSVEKIIRHSCRVIQENKDLLTELDQAIGDGDHGANMARGFAALLDKVDDISARTFEHASKQAGMILVMTVGGASGPLFGSCFMAFGKGRNAMPSSQTEIAATLRDGAEAVMARGKSDVGAKTMLDVLVPVSDYLAEHGDCTPQDVRNIADMALESTRNMLATKGRAAFLGERSVGHIDPGAKSVALLVHAVCDVLEARI